MPLPADYTERVYAGVLGKIIGVYLGRPFEGWTYVRPVWTSLVNGASGGNANGARIGGGGWRNLAMTTRVRGSTPGMTTGSTLINRPPSRSIAVCARAISSAMSLPFGASTRPWTRH